MRNSLKHYIFTNFGIGIKDELWLSYRLEIFINTVFPTLQNQKNKNFEWIIFIDEALATIYKSRLVTAMSASGLNVRTQAVSDYFLVNQEIEKILKNTKEQVVLTSRIDDDDCIREDVVEIIQNEASSAEHTDDVLLISLKNGIELLPSDNCYREVALDTLALALTLVSKSQNTKHLSITHYPHHEVVDTLKAQTAAS
ncbi:glycosyltransferase [Pseudomonas fontis]|uniref:Rhamnosyl transferase n=1 Tax=Pseudomonas fontis TaxID=2942633 RepID=A0ABT5NUU6_9PSED|nr:glycosyltransferase [Pseudomonas fontis]MDD0977169.1 putative rhamnosyl transferase [Pseudomonas fontis]MDD0991944.1 putative rhamnosyl transferase [Pseudomonas fontis]